MTFVMTFGAGSGYVPAPRAEVKMIDEAAEAAEAVLSDEELAQVLVPVEPSSLADSDTEPREVLPDRPDMTAALPPPPPPPVPRYEGGGVWEALAGCESDGRWDYNGGSGFDGGLQFLPSTWTAYKSDSHPSHAYLASPAQQIEVAKRVAAAQGAGAWPSCTAKLGITTEDLLNG